MSQQIKLSVGTPHVLESAINEPHSILRVLLKEVSSAVPKTCLRGSLGVPHCTFCMHFLKTLKRVKRLSFISK